MKIIDMLTANRENGPELRKSRWIWVLMVLFEVFSVWMCVTGVQKVLFLGRSPSGENQFYFVVPRPEQGKLLVVFQGEAKCLRAIRPYLPRRVVEPGTWESVHEN